MNNAAEALPENAEPTAETGLKPQQVADWLLENPEFFTQNPELLRKLELGTENHTGLSLHSRQLTSLRERINELENDLSERLDIAHNNEAVAQRLHDLLIKLIESKTERQLFHELERALTREFSVDFYHWHTASKLEHDIPEAVRKLRKQPSALMGRLNKNVLLSCFAQETDEVKSACLLSLHFQNQYLGLLALGSKDEMRFTDRPGTTLLERFGELLAGIVGSAQKRNA